MEGAHSYSPRTHGVCEKARALTRLGRDHQGARRQPLADIQHRLTLEDPLDPAAGPDGTLGEPRRQLAGDLCHAPGGQGGPPV